MFRPSDFPCDIQAVACGGYGGNHQVHHPPLVDVYKRQGYSGKNTDRPKFQELVRDIKRGLIAKVVVYKLDRISRSILDFANMMELFQQYNVEFVSSTEKFDTSTPMGRAMLNTVSYTHLDVYKRQQIWCGSNFYNRM